MKNSAEIGTPSRWMLCLIGGLLVLLFSSVTFLVSGSEWVNQPIFRVPAGNWAAWAALMTLSTLTLIACRSIRWLVWPARLFLLLAIIWYPLSVWLTGSLELSGAVSPRGNWWLHYTLSLVFVPWLLLFLRAMVAIVKRLWF